MENIILGVIFCVAVFYIGRRMWNTISGKSGGCNCGSSSCSSSKMTSGCGCCGSTKK